MTSTKRLLLPLSLALLALGARAQSEAPAACQDFYGHVNAAWLAQTELPASRSRTGSFDELARRNEAVLQAALASLSAQQAPTAGLRHAATVWASATDEAALERQGVAALAPLLQPIAALRTRDQLPALMAMLARAQVAAPIAIGVRPDPMDTRRYTLMLGQAGLTLPDRDDATGTDATAQRLREAARRYQAALLTAWQGQAPDAARLDALAAFEARLAQASTPRTQLRDPRANYHPHVAASLRAQAPELDWAALIQALKLPERAPARFVVGQPEFLAAVAREAANTELGVWRDYLAVRVLDAYAPGLNRAFQQAHFEYHGKTQRGLQAPAPRSERMVEAIGGRYGNAPLAQLLGEVFVQAAFPAEAAKRSAELVSDIKEAMRVRVRGLPWMSEATKQKALAKLDAMSLKIGAPARWPDYTGLVTRPDDLAGNLLRGAQWASAQRFNDLGRPVDRTRWFTSPHIVNAFAGGLNEITFPAGILQPPFFDAQADDASNFGGIGMVIGHEIIHHFDDRGRQFDGQGNLNDWWTPQDAAAYRERAAKVSALYGGVEALPGHRINGDLTLGENISDLGGLQIAFDALQRSLARHPAPPRADGRTPAQAFFVNQALVWRSKYRTEAMIQQLRTDSHSPPRYRVLIPMAHTEAFQKAFQCQAGDPMVAEARLTVW
ncbi:M13 family metallopeptidase [Inhella crocodyli]|uniref:M13 family peptidase n=1 Tax=Inhella crocodyli TaxID=2499851 RepID=A0A437LSV2_9BURK|nr:M13 family metallopeptidase [Inhella crocodyli]RVT88474.1 M13 family peptidase [Inhella crocodyli]